LVLLEYKAPQFIKDPRRDAKTQIVTGDFLL